uniref:Uncharacterized protein n=1 Tax=uncultured marine virus TaxID=186617 RepID=A0A0F7L5B3_9VIRU|nr:hypothetical protein [uncultured marine virus]
MIASGVIDSIVCPSSSTVHRRTVPLPVPVTDETLANVMFLLLTLLLFVIMY